MEDGVHQEVKGGEQICTQEPGVHAPCLPPLPSTERHLAQERE